MGQKIIPAILPGSFEELRDMLGEVASLARTVHIDACDGKFTPSVSWPYGDADRKSFDDILSEKIGLPFWDKLDFEAHLMVANPERVVAEWVHAGMSRIFVHAEAVKDISAAVKEIGDLTELGVALKFETSLDAFTPFAESAKALHLMSIARIGYQGEEFQEEAISKVREAHTRFPNVEISVDGGVSLDNAKELMDAGASRLIVGSALFKSADVVSAYKELVKIIDNGTTTGFDSVL